MKCTRHKRNQCWSCRNEPARSNGNSGQIGIDNQGDLTLGLGGGLTMDMSDGSLGVQVAPGFSLDFDGN